MTIFYVSNAQLTDYLFLQKIAALPFVEAIYLFGSRARGDHRERSDIDIDIDIDIAILSPNANESDWWSMLELIDEADTLLSIDCIRLDKESQNSALRLQIEQDKKLIYERRN
jgi:predicted nucleotidyltransferase